MNVLGFAGSLRTGSLNRALLRAVFEVAPKDMKIRVFEHNDIPLYNGDVEAEAILNLWPRSSLLSATSTQFSL